MPSSRIAALFQPIHARADVGYALPRGVDGASHIGGHGVIGAREARGPANVVVGHAQPQGRNAQHVEDAAQRVLADAVGVPLRQQHYRAMSLGGKPARVDQLFSGNGDETAEVKRRNCACSSLGCFLGGSLPV